MKLPVTWGTERHLSKEKRKSMATIPHPPHRVPIVGDVIGIDRVNPNTKTVEMFGRLGPIYRRSIMGTDLTFVGSAELAEQAFEESHWERFAGRPIVQLRDLAGDGLFTAANDSDVWTQAHSALMPAFSKEAMSRYYGIMQATSEQLAESLRANPGERLVQPLFARFAHEVIGVAGFGYSFGPDLLDNSHAFPAAMGRALQYVQKAAIPVVGKRPGEKRQYEQDKALLLNTVREVIAGRSVRVESKDLLDAMIAAGLPKESIEQQLLTFLIAGQETTASTLGFMVYELGQRPDLRDSVRAEVESVAGGDAVSFKDAPRLRLLRACISESLRLHPSAPGFFRTARHDTMLGDYSFAAGEWVFVLLMAVHRDREAWGPDAHDFNPHRFLDTGHRIPTSYRPFGTGIRSCIGRQFAQLELTLAMAELVRNLDWTIVSPSGPLELDETLTIRPRNLQVNFQPR